MISHTYLNILRIIIISHSLKRSSLFGSEIILEYKIKSYIVSIRGLGKEINEML